MLVRSLYRAKGTTLRLTSLLFLFVCSTQVLPSDFGDQTAIVEAYLGTNSEDRALAQSMAEQARERASASRNTLITNLGPFVKLWCDAATIAPNPENLAECARFHFKAVNQMSNPQPSEEVVRMQRVRESLFMIRAALEIAGGDPSVSDVLRYRLKSDADCFRSIISDAGANKDCK